MLLSCIQGDVKILDYTNSQVVAIDVGPARIQSGTIRLIHVVNLSDYEALINDISSAIKLNVTTSHPIYPFLIHEIDQIKIHLSYLRPRNKRSLNFVGSAWKWVAGNPDHDDFEILQLKIDNVLQNNNRQVVINRMSLEKINEITQSTNEVLRFVISETSKDSLINNLKYKLDIIRNEIMNLQYAIHWAKVGVLNSFILSDKEIKMVKNLYDTEKLTYSNIEESFELSEIKIAINHDSILYIINFPTINAEFCNNIIVTPLRSGTITNKIEYNEILRCKDRFFGIKRKCKGFDKLLLCKDDDIRDISSSECLPNLIRSKPSNCTLIKNEQIPEVHEIIPGNLLLNQFNGTVFIGHEPFFLNGTFLIKFHNETISVNGKTFSLSEIVFSDPLPPVLQTRVDNPNVEEALTLQSVKEMHVDNMKAIALLRSRNWLRDIPIYALAILSILIILSVCVKRSCQPKKETFPGSICLNTSLPIHNVSLGESEINKHPIARITQIPYF